MNDPAFIADLDPASASAEWNGFVTVQEAARLMRVSTSTIWRRIRAGSLPAYRMGGRRIWLRRADLAALVEPADATQPGETMKKEDLSLEERPLTDAEQRQILAAVEAARVRQKEMLEARGRPFRSAAEDIREAREERSASRS